VFKCPHACMPWLGWVGGRVLLRGTHSLTPLYPIRCFVLAPLSSSCPLARRFCWLNYSDDITMGHTHTRQLLRPVAMAEVPWLGLVVRDVSKPLNLRVYVSPNGMAMAAMSPLRVGWMLAVMRAAWRRQGVGR
jgi:hypothetical protein